MKADRATAALAVSVAALVPAVYAAALPAMSDARARVDRDGALATSELAAAAVAGSVVAGVAIVTRSPEVAGVGLVAVLAFATAYACARKATPGA